MASMNPAIPIFCCCLGIKSFLCCLPAAILFSRPPLKRASSKKEGLMNAKEVVCSFWEAMQSNDFYQASLQLSDDFECFWPQSAELIIGRENFAKINAAYPAHGQWDFKINTLVGEGSQVVTDVSITDGVQKARAITFHTIENGRIRKQVEFWPEDYEAPEWRAGWVKKIDRL
jgi:limonene-1,2-epoxide hydrolase